MTPLTFPPQNFSTLDTEMYLARRAGALTRASRFKAELPILFQGTEPFRHMNSIFSTFDSLLRRVFCTTRSTLLVVAIATNFGWITDSLSLVVQ
jgi:hypothetical protein